MNVGDVIGLVICGLAIVAVVCAVIVGWRMP